MDYSEMIMNIIDLIIKFKNNAGVNKVCPISSSFKATTFRVTSILGAVIILSSACIPPQDLEYPDIAQDFLVEVEEPLPRADATPPITSQLDALVDLGITEDVFIPNVEPSPPTLRTTGVDFIGKPESTYNGVEPTIRGRYLWILPKEINQPKSKREED
jgi:hypothetical protein